MRRTAKAAFCLAFVSLALSARAALAAPSTTLVISEFRTTGPTGGNDEFVEIFNLTSAPFDASGYQIWGSNSSGTTGQRLLLPSGTIIPPRGFFLATNSMGYSGTVAGDKTYITGITDTGGLALLDKANKVVDAVGLNSGSAYKEGTTLAPLSSGQDASYRRKSANCTPDVDTDNNAADFVLVTPSTPQNAGSCCLDAQCSKPPAGQCYGATGTCDVNKGTCSYGIAPGKACDDGNACTVSDACLASGACQGSTKPCDTPPPPVCLSAGSQRSYAATGTCSAGACSYASVDTSCACNAATGLCQDPCAGVACATPPNAQCYDAAGACNPQTGSCAYTKKPQGTGCDDGQPCTVGDACDATGACTGAPKVCTPPPAECVGSSSRVYSGGTCSPLTGACGFSQADTPCSFGCDPASGLCKPNPCAGVSCTTPPGACFQALGVCDTASGQCVYTPKPAGTACDDGQACTDGDSCNGAGTCAGSAKVCAPPPPQCVGSSSRSFSSGVCNVATGACAFQPIDTPCASGCDAATGLCKNDPCAGVSCSSPPTQCHQATGTCSGGVCSYALKPENAQCDDGDPCTGPDRCTAAGACVGTTTVCNTPPSPSCSSPSTSLAYAPVGACQAGACSYTEAPTACAFGCDAGTGLCVGDPCAEVTCTTPPSACHVAVGSCSNGTCTYALKQAGAACDDADACTTADACDLVGACKGTPKACNAPPAPFCVDGKTSRQAAANGSCKPDGSCDYATTDTTCALGCDGATGLCSGDACAAVTCDKPPSPCHAPKGTCSGGQCSYAPLQPGAACNDGDPCTTGDACNAQGLCAGSPKVCNSPPAPECTSAKVSQAASPAGACSPVDGTCGYDVVDTTCAVGCDLKTGLCIDDPCNGVSCTKPPSACHLAQGECKQGSCSYPLKPAGAACDDGDKCTGPDTCDAAGECKGKPAQGPGCAGSGGASGQGGSGGKGGASGQAGGQTGGQAGSQGGSAGKAGQGGSGGKAGASGKAGSPAAGGGSGQAGSGQAGSAQAGPPDGDAASVNAPGCGCVVPHGSTPPSGLAPLAALALALGRARARRRRAG